MVTGVTSPNSIAWNREAACAAICAVCQSGAVAATDETEASPIVALSAPSNSAQRVLVFGGFLGALIVIRPGSGLFDAAALLALGVALCNAAYQIETNHRGAQEDAVTTNFHAGWVGLGLSLAWLMASSDTSVAALWTSKPVNVLLLMAMALLATVAQLALITALSRANAATLMPFTYVQIGVAALAGWVALGDLPDAWSWVGMAVIAACGAASAWSTARQSMPCLNTLKCTRSTRS